MSRIGKMPIPVPAGVKVSIQDGRVEMTGPKGTLSTGIPDGVAVALEDGQLQATRKSDQKEHRALHGLIRALLANNVTGVTQGFEKRLDVIGVGYRAAVQGEYLNLSLGFSHPIQVPIPEGIEISVEKTRKNISQYVATLTLKGIDKAFLGQIAADIRALRKPDPYKGKGIRYEGETVRLKVGKKGA